MNSKNTTKEIAGTEITLTEGRYYEASHGIARRPSEIVKVFIRDIAEQKKVVTLEMTRIDARQFCIAFNDGRISTGRQW